MVGAVEGDEFGAGDQRGHQLAFLVGHDRVAPRVEHERRAAYLPREVADIEHLPDAQHAQRVCGEVAMRIVSVNQRHCSAVPPGTISEVNTWRNAAPRCPSLAR